MRGAVRRGEQRLVDRGGTRQHRDPRVLDQPHRRVRVEGGDGVEGGAGQQSDDDADLVAEGVEERVHHQVAVLRSDPAEAAPCVRNPDRLPVRAHRALGAPGGAGGEQDVGDVVGGDPVGPRLDLVCERVVAELGHPVEAGEVDDLEHRGQVAGCLQVDDLGAVEKAVRDEHKARAGAVDDVGDLVAGVAAVRGDQGSACVGDGQAGDHPVDAVGRPHHDAVAALEAERHVAAGDGAHLVEQVGEREGPVALDVRRPVAVPLGSGPQHPGQRARTLLRRDGHGRSCRLGGRVWANQTSAW